MATTINISDITSNVNVDTNNVVTGDGYFDDLMETVNTHLKAQYDLGRITGDAYARVYMSMAQSAMGQAINFALAKRNTELKADMAEQDLGIKEDENYVSNLTKDNKVSMVASQLAKIQAETSYIDEQETQLENSVNFNNKIKALDSLADTYGTFGAGGLTVSSDMWNTYFSIVSDLATATAPTSTTVTKVT